MTAKSRQGPPVEQPETLVSTTRQARPASSRLPRPARRPQLLGAAQEIFAGLGKAEAHLLGMALVGMAQVSSRYWLSTDRAIPKDAAEQLLSRLAWRGISGWPMTTG